MSSHVRANYALLSLAKAYIINHVTPAVNKGAIPRGNIGGQYRGAISGGNIGGGGGGCSYLF